jgi:hypothetical protein
MVFGKIRKPTSAVIAAMIIIAGGSCARAAAVLDQNQFLYDGGVSARTLPGYKIWETFTAGITGTLVEIDLGFFDSIIGTGKLDVFSGGPPFGAPLSSTDVSVFSSGIGALNMNSFAVDAPITTGAIYAFEFTPIDMPDPYGVGLGVLNPDDPEDFHPPYPGGNAGLTDPSGIYNTSWNFVFETYVEPTSAPEPPAMWLLAIPTLLFFVLFPLKRRANRL